MEYREIQKGIPRSNLAGWEWMLSSILPSLLDRHSHIQQIHPVRSGIQFDLDFLAIALDDQWPRLVRLPRGMLSVEEEDHRHRLIVVADEDVAFLQFQALCL